MSPSPVSRAGPPSPGQPARSRARSLSTVTTTVALFDALLLGIAARDRDRALAGLAQLNRLRERVAGRHVPLDRDLRDVDLLSPERPADT